MDVPPHPPACRPRQSDTHPGSDDTQTYRACADSDVPDVCGVIAYGIVRQRWSFAFITPLTKVDYATAMAFVDVKSLVVLRSWRPKFFQ
jgi:hypothetical protein